MFLPDGWEFFSKFSDILSKQRRSADNKRFFFVAYMILLVAKHLNKVTIDAFKPRDVGISEMTDMCFNLAIDAFKPLLAVLSLSAIERVK